MSLLMKNQTTTKELVDPSVAWKLTGQSYLKGPDQILPSEAISTTQADGATRIIQNDPIEGRVPITPISVPSLVDQAAERTPMRTALAIKRNGEWHKWTFQDYRRDVKTVAKAFIALGLERFHSVSILGFNSPEWFFSKLGAIFAGGFATGIYTTNSAEACAYCAKDSRTNIFIVEDEIQLAKVLEIRSQLPHLKAIVQYTGLPIVDGVMSWADLMTLGKNQPESILEDRLCRISINQCCTLIYTSGTTGAPKGVMLSHDNLVWNSHTTRDSAGYFESQEESISYLPMSHVAAQVADIYIPLINSSTIYFADKNALKGSLIDTIREVQPTNFFAVPRVWEKFYEKLQEIGASTKGAKKTLVTWAKSKSLEYHLQRSEQGNCVSKSLSFKIADQLVLSKVRKALGFSKCRHFFCGAAPLSPQVLNYFLSLNIVIFEVFGMSECTGAFAGCTDSIFRVTSCGKGMPGCLVKLKDSDKFLGSDGTGEIILNGRAVFMGYLNQPEKTLAAIDSDGWLHSEDLGYFDKDEFLFVTGRLKELLITAGGENVAPLPIEERIKIELPFVSQAVVLGDSLKFLSVLLTLKSEMDKDTQEPFDTLLPSTKNWIENHGQCKVDTVTDVLNQLDYHKNQKLRVAIQQGIDQANSKAVSNAQTIKKWQILPLDFSIFGGELGPTLKLKRQTIYKKYEGIINKLYD